MKPDGSQKKMIEGIYKANCLNFKDGYIYYLNNGDLYRNTLDGSKKKTINNTQHKYKIKID